MFYIYTPTGRSFSGTLEKLRRVEKPLKTFDANRTDRDPIDYEANANTDIPISTNYDIAQPAIQAYQDLIPKTESREPIKHAYQVMSMMVQSLDETATIAAALAAFKKVPFQMLPIINVRQAVIGCLSRKQLYEFLIDNPDKEKLKNVSIKNIFINSNTKVVSAAPVTDIRRIASVLVDYKLDAIPVVDENEKLVGIVSRTDILKSATTDPPLSLWC